MTALSAEFRQYQPLGSITFSINIKNYIFRYLFLFSYSVEASNNRGATTLNLYVQ